MNIGICSAATAELWGIIKGMELAWNQGVRQLIVESDSVFIIANIISRKASGYRSSFFKQIGDWQNRDWNLIFSHTYREGNNCANWLANWALAVEPP